MEINGGESCKRWSRSRRRSAAHDIRRRKSSVGWRIGPARSFGATGTSIAANKVARSSPGRCARVAFVDDEQRIAAIYAARENASGRVLDELKSIQFAASR